MLRELVRPRVANVSVGSSADLPFLVDCVSLRLLRVVFLDRTNQRFGFSGITSAAPPASASTPVVGQKYGLCVGIAKRAMVAAAARRMRRETMMEAAVGFGGGVGVGGGNMSGGWTRTTLASKQAKVVARVRPGESRAFQGVHARWRGTARPWLHPRCGGRWTWSSA